MQSIVIDLKKNPDIAELVRTMHPGDYIGFHSMIKALDDQTLTATIESAEEEEPPDAEEGGADNDEHEGDEQTPPGGDMDIGAPAGGGADARVLTGGETAAT